MTKTSKKKRKKVVKKPVKRKKVVRKKKVVRRKRESVEKLKAEVRRLKQRNKQLARVSARREEQLEVAIYLQKRIRSYKGTGADKKRQFDKAKLGIIERMAQLSLPKFERLRKTRALGGPSYIAAAQRLGFTAREAYTMFFSPDTTEV